MMTLSSTPLTQLGRVMPGQVAKLVRPSHAARVAQGQAPKPGMKGPNLRAPQTKAEFLKRGGVMGIPGTVSGRGPALPSIAPGFDLL